MTDLDQDQDKEGDINQDKDQDQDTRTNLSLGLDSHISLMQLDTDDIHLVSVVIGCVGGTFMKGSTHPILRKFFQMRPSLNHTDCSIPV